MLITTTQATIDTPATFTIEHDGQRVCLEQAELRAALAALGAEKARRRAIRANYGQPPRPQGETQQRAFMALCD